MNQQLRRLQQDGRCSKEGSHELFFSERPAELAKAGRGRPRHAERNLPVEASRSELLELVNSV